MNDYISKKWHEKALFFLIFRYEKERKAVFYKSHNPKVVSSNLAPATKMKRTFKQVEVIGKEEMITHLPECSFLLYPISCFLSGLVSRVFSAHFLLT